MVAVRTSLQRPGVELSPLTVEVDFGSEGTRKVPAHYEHATYTPIGSPVGFAQLPIITPDDIEGYIFSQEIGGKWHAIRSRR